MRRASSVFLLTMLAILAAEPAHASCGAESCALDNSLIGGDLPRLSFELSYQFVDQDRLRVGSSSGDLQAVRTEGGEMFTRSNVVMGKVYASMGRWLLSASAPYVRRTHRHVTAEGVPEPEYREWSFGGLGDVTFLASWTAHQSPGPAPLSLALQGGFKAPTGRRTITSIAGEQPEPHARPGTGSTDWLVGMQAVKLVDLPGLSGPGTVFVSTLYTHTGHGTDGYRVGRMLDASAGASIPVLERLSVLAQLNLRDRARDHQEGASETGVHGHAAEPAAIQHEGEAHTGHVAGTGGTSLYASPGLRYALREGVAASAYVQLPLVQRLNGAQAAAPYQLWFGVLYTLR